MILKLLAAPLLGALIGYITNWLAVKMLFRPREAKYIGGRRLPFTPGVIPKGKDRLARAAADIVNSQLLTEKAIREHLTSGEFMELLKSTAHRLEKKLKADERTFRKYLAGSAGEERLEKNAAKARDFLAEKAAERLAGMNLGKAASGILAEKIAESLSGSFLGKMLGDSVIPNIAAMLEKKIDGYIEENGEELLRPFIEREIDNLLDKRIGDTVSALAEAEIDIDEILLKVYSEFIVKKAPDILRTLNIGAIAEKAVREMDGKELESLVLSAMKTELKAVVNLGALIGFLLGLFNLAIYFV